VYKSNQQFKGSGLVALSAIFFASYGIWSKLMAIGLDEFSQAWTRALILLPIIGLIGLVFKQFKPIKKVDFPWFILIGLMGALNQAPYYYGFLKLPIGTATLLFYLGLTLGGYILGPLLFKEKIDKFKWLALSLGVIGLITIYKFELNLTLWLPATASLVAGLMGATAVVSTKKLSSHYSELQVISSYLVFMLPINFLIGISTHQTIPNLDQTSIWLPAIGYALSFLTANLLVTAGFKYLEPSVGAIIGLLEIIFAIIFGAIVFKETATLVLLFGCGLILSAAILPDLKKLILKARDN